MLAQLLFSVIVLKGFRVYTKGEILGYQDIVDTIPHEEYTKGHPLMSTVQ